MGSRACRQCHRVKRLVHISTALANGCCMDGPLQELGEPGRCLSECARTKHLGDLAVKSLTEKSRPAVVTLFLGCVVGRGDTFAAADQQACVVTSCCKVDRRLLPPIQTIFMSI